MENINKIVIFGNNNIPIAAEKIVRKDRSVVIKVTATVGDILHTQMWTLPKDNHEYTQEQAQKDFDEHCLKVAKSALGLSVAHSVTENLK